jgi:very-short-patch-repair endonuclease
MPDERRHDAARTAFLEREGWTVIRFWNSEIYTNLYGVLDSILQRLPPPSRRPSRRSTSPKPPA